MVPASDAFLSLYQRAPEYAAQAPGRVNLFGVPTDYNGGFVLPVAIPQRVNVELARRPDLIVRASSVDIAPGHIFKYRLGEESRASRWIDYVQGVTATLHLKNQCLRGFDMLVRSDVPVGCGLSSSGALEVAVIRALDHAFALGLNAVECARIGHQAENEFVGARVGIMDQMAACLGDERNALFLDTRTLEYQRVPLPAEAALIVIDSGVTHDHTTGAYNRRRAECEHACELLGVSELRDIGPKELSRIARLPSPFDRRARHVVTENQRVIEAVDALLTGDLTRLGLLFDASHRSMRDDFEVSVPAIDALVAIAGMESEVYGARLTGGGFGGSAVILARAGSADHLARRIAHRYEHETRWSPTIHVPLVAPFDGE